MRTLPNTDESSLCSNSTAAIAVHSSSAYDRVASCGGGLGSEDAGTGRSGGCGCSDNSALLLAAGALAFGILNMQLQQIITLLTGGGRRRRKRRRKREEEAGGGGHGGGAMNFGGINGNANTPIGCVNRLCEFHATSWREIGPVEYFGSTRLLSQSGGRLELWLAIHTVPCRGWDLFFCCFADSCACFR